MARSRLVFKLNDNAKINQRVDSCRACPLCGSFESIRLGIRGNREFFGANLSIEPHVRISVIRCESCDFIFCDPTIAAANRLEGAYYEQKYPEISDLDPNISVKYRRGLSLIMKYKREGPFLDVGAGIGGAVSLATKKGFSAIGIEPSLKSCEYANRAGNLHIFPGHLEEHFPADGMGFEVISLFHVLEHVVQPRELLSLIKLRLCSSGIVYIEVPNGDSFLLRIVDVFYALIGKGWSSRLSPLHPPFHSVAFSPRSLRHLLQSEGFDILRLNTFTHHSVFRPVPTIKLKILELIRYSVSLLFSFLPNGEIVYVIASKSKQK
jgi:SAM-dependent methyltransferase